MRDEDLIGYLLGALDAPEQQQLKRQLTCDPELRAELERLRQLILPLADSDPDVEPPAGLAARTLSMVEDQRAQPVDSHPTGQHLWADRHRTATAGAGRFWREKLVGRRPRLADVLTGTLACLIPLLLLFPALVNARWNAQLEVCQWKLQQLGNRLMSLANSQSDFSYPSLGTHPHENFAGMMAVALVDSELVGPRSSLFICPSSPLTLEQWNGTPSRERIRQASADDLDDLRKQAGGSYGYPLGYELDGVHHQMQHTGNAFQPILVDRPSYYLPNLMSDSHARKGYNILFDDGHVRFVSSKKQNCGAVDDVYRNSRGYVGPGTNKNDACLGCSEATAFPVQRVRYVPNSLR